MTQVFSAAWLFQLCALLVSGFPANAGPSGPLTWGNSVTVGGGWGRMVQLTNGHWLCVTTRYPVGTNSFLRIQRSTNNARTWADFSEVREAGRTLDNGELIALSDGTILLTMRSLILDVSYKLPVYASSNGGASWTYRSNIDTSEGLSSKGLWEPDFWELANGLLIVTYSNEKHSGYSQVISQKMSGDQGVTWGDEFWAVSQPGGGNLRPGMSQVAHMANGQYILVYEIVNSGQADVHSKISLDGTNWPAGLGNRIPCHHCGPFVASLPNGLVLVSSCENQVSFSEDYGETWQKIDPPAWELGYYFSWPAIYCIQTNEVGVMLVTNGTRLRFGALSPRPLWPNPFTESFDRGTDTGWARYGGNFGFDAGRYLLSNEGTSGKAMAGDGFWTDGALEADVMLTSNGNAGLLFRATNPDYVGPDYVSGYYAGISSSGSVLLGRMNNAWTSLTNRPMTIGTNVWHHLKVTLEGSQISVFVDDLDTPSFTLVDTNFTRGQIGLRAHQCNAQFDNAIYSNAVPLQLQLKPLGKRLSVAWPRTSATIKLFSVADVTSQPAGLPVTNLPALSNGQSGVNLEVSDEAARIFWLRGQ